MAEKIKKFMHQRGAAQLPIIIGLLLLGVALPAGLRLVEQQQEIRMQAGDVVWCGHCLQNPDGSYDNCCPGDFDSDCVHFNGEGCFKIISSGNGDDGGSTCNGLTGRHCRHQDCYVYECVNGNWERREHCGLECKNHPDICNVECGVAPPPSDDPPPPPPEEEPKVEKCYCMTVLHGTCSAASQLNDCSFSVDPPGQGWGLCNDIFCEGIPAQPPPEEEPKVEKCYCMIVLHGTCSAASQLYDCSFSVDFPGQGWGLCNDIFCEGIPAQPPPPPDDPPPPPADTPSPTNTPTLRPTSTPTLRPTSTPTPTDTHSTTSKIGCSAWQVGKLQCNGNVVEKCTETVEGITGTTRTQYWETVDICSGDTECYVYDELNKYECLPIYDDCIPDGVDCDYDQPFGQQRECCSGYCDLSGGWPGKCKPKPTQETDHLSTEEPDFLASEVLPGCPRKSEGDANCDGIINSADFSIWRRETFDLGANKIHGDWRADFNGDGYVNFADLSILLSNYD